MLTLFLETQFDSAHHLPGHPKCDVWHGHTYRLEVEVSGQVGEDGMILDFYVLNDVVQDSLPDHRVLNDVVENPTVENLIAHLAVVLSARLRDMGVQLVSLKLYEGLGKGAKWTA